MKTETAFHNRWMVRGDLHGIMDVAAQCFSDPWTRDEWLAALRQRDCVARVACQGRLVCGYMVYGLRDDEYRVLAVAVAPTFRSQGCGRELVTQLVTGFDGIGPMSRQGRRRMWATVPEDNGVALYFFRALKFRAVQVVKGRDVDLIRMRRMYFD